MVIFYITFQLTKFITYFQTAYNLLQYEVSSIVCPMIIRDALGSGIVLYLWHINPDLIMRGFLEAESTDPDIITKVLDICQDLKVSIVELLADPYYFFCSVPPFSVFLWFSHLVVKGLAEDIHAGLDCCTHAM